MDGFFCSARMGQVSWLRCVDAYDGIHPWLGRPFSESEVCCRGRRRGDEVGLVMCTMEFTMGVSGKYVNFFQVDLRCSWDWMPLETGSEAAACFIFITRLTGSGFFFFFWLGLAINSNRNRRMLVGLHSRSSDCHIYRVTLGRSPACTE